MKSLDTIHFTHYFEYHISENGIPRPVVVVTFIKGEQEIDFLMLVDSGSYWTALPPEVSDALDIDLTELTTYEGTGVGGSFLYNRIENIEMHMDQDNIIFHGPIIFNHSIKGWPHGVLGRETFFENFKVGFKQHDLYQILLAKEA